MTEKDSVIVIKSDWGKPPVAIIETPNETYPETNIANSVLKTIFVTSLGSSGLAQKWCDCHCGNRKGSIAGNQHNKYSSSCHTLAIEVWVIKKCIFFHSPHIYSCLQAVNYTGLKPINSENNEWFPAGHKAPNKGFRKRIKSKI